MDMEVLTAEREIINETDREMARLFEQRMEAVRRIAMWKKEHGLPILDAKREQEVIERNLRCIQSDDLRGDYELFIRNVRDNDLTHIKAVDDSVHTAHVVGVWVSGDDIIEPRHAKL